MFNEPVHVVAAKPLPRLNYNIWWFTPDLAYVLWQRLLAAISFVSESQRSH